MIDRTFQHFQDRHDEGQHHEGKQGQHQKEGAPFGFALRLGQRRFQRATVCGAQHVGGSGQINHVSSLRSCNQQVPRPNAKWEIVEKPSAASNRARSSDQFAASHALKRSFSSASWSTQNSNDEPSAFAIFSGAVGTFGPIRVLPSLYMIGVALADLRAGP